MNHDSEVLPVLLSSGAAVHFEVRVLSGEEEVSLKPFSFQSIVERISEIAEEFKEVLAKVHPDKATIEFGVDLGVEAGQLTTLIVKGAATGSFKIALEWNKEKEPAVKSMEDT